jgi:hypothetical protein
MSAAPPLSEAEQWAAYIQSDEALVNCITTSTYRYQHSSSRRNTVVCVPQGHFAAFVAPRNVAALAGIFYPVAWLGQPDDGGIVSQGAPAHAICVPRSVTGIGAHLNSQKTSAIAFELGSQVAIIDESVFCNCDRLSAVWLPSSVQSLYADCFKGCVNLSLFLFAPNSQLKVIRQSAFARCVNLRSICLPSSVESIPDKCFEDCSRLCNLTYEADSKIASIGTSALANCPALTAFCIPPLVKTLSVFFSPQRPLVHLTVDPQNTHFHIVDELLLDRCEREVVYCIGDAREVTIEKSIQVLNTCAF